MHLATKSYVAATLLAILTSTACNRTPAYEWRPLEAPDGTFSVALPGDAVKEDTPTKSVTGGYFIVHSFKSRASKNAAYGCSWWEDPSFKGRTAEQILETARGSGLSGINGKLLTEKRLIFRGHPARDIQAIARGNATYDNRLVVVGNRLYTLLVLDVSGNRDRQNVEKFFNSLVVH